MSEVPIGINPALLAERTRPPEAVTKEWVTKKFTEWIKLNHELSKTKKEQEKPISPKFKEPTSETRPFDIGTLTVKKYKPDIPDIENASSAEKIYSILDNRDLRRGGRDEEWIDTKSILDKLDKMTSTDKPIEIILPALPSKNQNPLTTRHSLQEVDLGEYVLFSQLRNICSSIEDIYKPGAKITILADGQIYANLFSGGNKEAINKYRENCEKIRDEFGLQGKVEIINMETLISDRTQLTQTQEQIKKALLDSETENQGKDSEFNESMKSLQKSLLHIIPDDKNKYEEYASYISKPLEELPEEMQKRLHETAIEYASIYLAMGKLNIAEHSFPDALRATVHRKKKSQQFPMRLTNRDTIIFPWHGVPVISEKKINNIPKNIRIMRYGQMLSEPDVKAIYRPGDKEPFYYLTK